MERAISMLTPYFSRYRMALAAALPLLWLPLQVLMGFYVVLLVIEFILVSK